MINGGGTKGKKVNLSVFAADWSSILISIVASLCYAMQVALR